MVSLFFFAGRAFNSILVIFREDMARWTACCPLLFIFIPERILGEKKRGGFGVIRFFACG